LNVHAGWKTTKQMVWSATAMFCLSVLVACNSSKQGATTESKQYALKGTVVSIDKSNSSMVVNGDAIPGFMDAMAMQYKVKNPQELDAVAVGDSITATIVKQDDDYVLQDVKVTVHPKALPPQPSSVVHMPERGEAVPNFKLVNQSGRRISLDQYRGKTLLVTFIYTRCPFADYCPRITSEFAEINQELRKDSSLYEKTHLLSISFDPKHDTPKVLRSYGASYMKEKRPEFTHWEFAVPSTAELPDVAKYFGVSVVEDGGLITHSLSTAVIGPDGKIFKWYHGNDWKTSDLLKDAADATHAAA
jgi:protein SCO1